MTKAASSTVTSVESLQAQLAAIQQQIASLTSTKLRVTPEAVRRFTIDHWTALQAALVVDGSVKSHGRITGKLRADRKGYALVKGCNPAWYMAVKGFVGTMVSRENNGLPVELNNIPNDKGRTQVLYAQEILQQLGEAGFVDLSKPLFTGAEPKARKSNKK